MTEQHHWAAYDTAGKVLETNNRVGELSYWLYKNKVEGTVGPYPDRDRPMLELTTVCEQCDGTGHERYAVHMFPLDEDGNAIPEANTKWDPTRDPEDPVTCPFCKGLKWIKKGYGGQEFKSATTMKAAITKGTAQKCHHCRQVGTVIYMPILRDCYGCKGTGMRPTWDSTRPVLPPQVSDCDDATAEFMEAWLRDITITVIRDNVGLSWGEAHLGFMGLYSVVDYGERWARDDDTALIWDVVEKLTSDRTQFIKMIDRDTRQFGHALVIKLATNGYTPLVVGAEVFHGLGALPPTYFPTVFEETR